MNLWAKLNFFILLFCFKLESFGIVCPKNGKEWDSLKVHVANNIDDLKKDEYKKELIDCVEKADVKYQKNCLQNLYFLSQPFEYENNAGRLYNNVGREKWFGENKDLIGLETIPDAIKSADFFNKIKDPNISINILNEIAQDLAQGLPENKRNSVLVTRYQVDPKSDDASELDDQPSGRIVIHYDDGYCRKTYTISSKIKPEEENGSSYAVLAVCYKEKNDRVINPPEALLHRYGLENSDNQEPTVLVETQDGQNDVHGNTAINCINCHIYPGILFRPDGESEVNDQRVINQINEINNHIVSDNKISVWRPPKDSSSKNPIVNGANQSQFYPSTGMNLSVNQREEVFSNCLNNDCGPGDQACVEEFNNSKIKLNEAMKCASCHNGVQENIIPIYARDKWILDISVKSSNPNHHPMPPEKVLEDLNIPKANRKKFREKLLRCLKTEMRSSAGKSEMLMQSKPCSSNSNERCPTFAPSCEHYDLALEELEILDDSFVCNSDLININIDEKVKVFEDMSGQFRIDDPFNKDGPTNDYLSCTPNENIPYVRNIRVVPSCSGTCGLYEVDLYFDKDGNFKGMKTCDLNCPRRPEKYGGELMTDSELQKTSEFVLQQLKKEKEQNIPSSMNWENDVVDGLTGATYLGSRGAVKGAAYTTQSIFQYVKHTIKEIKKELKNKNPLKRNLKKTCDKYRKLAK